MTIDPLDRTNPRYRPVRIRYGEQDIAGRWGERLLDAILAAGIEHRHVCGGRGFCTSCRVEVVGLNAGLSAVSPLERERLGRDAGHIRLACQTMLTGDAVVRVPQPARFGFGPDGE